MWDQGYDNAGGFDHGVSSSQGGGATPGGAGRRARAQNLVPVSIKDILTTSGGEEAGAADAAFKVEGREVGMVDLVGRVLSVDRKPTKTVYQLDDGTGTIEAVHWTDAEKGQGSDEGSAASEVSENMHARIVGSVRSKEGTRHVMVFRVSPVDGEGEVDAHVLETVHARLKMRQLNDKENKAIGMNSFGGGGGLSNSMMATATGSGSTSSASFGNSKHDAVIKVLSGCTREEGLSRDEMMQQLKGRLNRKDLDDALEYLSGEGHIYSTMDEDHFRTTDA